MTLPRTFRLALTTALLATALAACSKEKSFVVVEVVSNGPMIEGVRHFGLDVHNGDFDDTLTYPKDVPGAPIKEWVVTSTAPVTLSVSFETSFAGLLDVAVTPKNGAGAELGYGVATAAIDPGHVTRVQVIVDPTKKRPPTGLKRADGGVDAMEPSCDPVSPTACGAGMSCDFNCDNSGHLAPMCHAAGSIARTQVCRTRGDCVVGAECLTDVCGVSTCQQLCRTDNDCAGVTGSRCLLQSDVPCGGTPTGIRICSEPCEPTGAATAGCAQGLVCIIVDVTNELTRCECPSTRGMRKEGEACTAGECSPGLVCDNATCRKLCRQDATVPCATPQRCVVPSGWRSWGVCRM